MKRSSITQFEDFQYELFIAIESKFSLQEIGLLLRRGADVNKVNQYGISPLFLACSKG